MTLICVLGMSLLVVSQHYFTKQLIGLNKQRAQLLILSQDLLQMRRHEKDFLLRKNLLYVDKFERRQALFTEHLNELQPLFSLYELPISEAGQLAQSIDLYQSLFKQVVTLHRSVGLDSHKGLRGELSASANLLKQSSSFDYGNEARRYLSDAMLSVKSYQLTQDEYERESVLSSINKIKLESEFDTKTNALINKYQDDFNTYSQLITQLGINENEGLRGQFRDQAHKVEEQLDRIDHALQPLIFQQEEKVKVYSLSIAILTSVALILLLVKSFATFHRSFSNFVMFFYRCKRQYQKIDTRKLGFSEFKSLAELANEMVESRKQTEVKLAKAVAELEQHQ